MGSPWFWMLVALTLIGSVAGQMRGIALSTCVTMLVPEERQLKGSEFVVVERTTRLPSAIVRDGVPLTPVVRACLDVARYGWRNNGRTARTSPVTWFGWRNNGRTAHLAGHLVRLA